MNNFSKGNLFIAFLLLQTGLIAQKDTVFWFVAPEISQGNYNYDRPVAFRFSTYDAPAIITISQPANPLFPVQTIAVTTNASGLISFPPLFDAVENKPPNMILNRGFLIKSTSPVTAYYEVIGEYQSNPEIFSLKGQNALGTEFYVPFQNIIENSAAYSPLPSAAFDIVATEDNTLATITPTRALVGHPANIPFSLTLDQGQSYSAQAASQGANGHPSGSHVVASKPIAITVKDDLLESGIFYGGFCRDMMGDQITPIRNLGTRHVVQKGLLNGLEYAFVTATVTTTEIKFDGQIVATMNAGQTQEFTISNGSHFIESSAPVSVFQLSGNGCEVAGEVIPALDCGGSRSVRFVRTNEEPFVMFLVTESGNESGFMLNGASWPFPLSAFQPVPGSNGEFVAATFSISTSYVPANVSSSVANSLGLFQMGFLNGESSATGCRFGYFSDFNQQALRQDSVIFCQGDTVQAYGLTISHEGIYYLTIDGALNCDTLLEITFEYEELPMTEREILLCPGQSIMLNGIVYHEPASLSDTIFNPDGCDTLRLTTILFDPPSLSFLPADTFICSGQTLQFISPYAETTWNGMTVGQNFEATTPGLVVATFVNENNCPGLDSVDIRNCCSSQGLYLPNVFSPNDDGLHDEFCVFATEVCAHFTLRVYDRWGELLFEALTPGHCWDGKFRGKPQPAGIYVWVVEIFSEQSQKQEVLTGDLLLVR